ncbi:maleylpyruvate isomerase family mycothiol-dependent enzyme [Actinomadura spongiicola]|uniref:Maleylpyruvate isomerase family mycothiol-dependent enzyme n=1 Tax=Actinomadura spongiicola TaxID=2303421 RepID=A0A372GNU0_9ACTN|nr:maleylpyruvate isomerase family mycothiol-dependent enzyme [Actinomadura spongiicola]RFS87034.1 maleylpyruvate isomerase family mycothiol-dependent enzyme [Actinomadura spongiicola]
MTEPPLDLRARTLRAALSRRAPARPAPGFARPYAAIVSMLDALLTDLPEADWTTIAVNGWDTRDLVAHLTATDGLLVEAIAGVESSADDVPARTAELTGRRLPLRDTRRTWRRQADELCDRLGDSDADRQVEMGGFRMCLSDHLFARAFETWIHATDIGQATGRALPPPLAEHVHPLADFGARILPSALVLTGREHPDQTLRLILDGPGGGEWTVPLGSGTADVEPSVRVRMDVIEFCFLAGGRRDPESVRAETSGDPAVTRDVLASVPAFSGP